jgi:hypothetical protein
VASDPTSKNFSIFMETMAKKMIFLLSNVEFSGYEAEETTPRSDPTFLKYCHFSTIFFLGGEQ